MESADDSKQTKKFQASEAKEAMSGKDQFALTQPTSQSPTDKTITDESHKLYSTSKTQNQSYYGANDNYDLLQLPPPPVHLHPVNFLHPLHPPWDLPRVPTAHATLPLHLQNLPPPPPPPLTVSSPAFTAETKIMLERTTENKTSTETSVTVSLCDSNRPLPIVSSIQRTIQRKSTLPEKPLKTLACSSWKDVHTKADFRESVTHSQQ